MNTRVKTLVDEVRMLSLNEQHQRLAELTAVIDAAMGVDDDGAPADGTPAEIEAAWDEEVTRRFEADARGETVWTPAATVMARLRRP
jgi:hypothetical protein